MLEALFITIAVIAVLYRFWKPVLIFLASLVALDIALCWLIAHCGTLLGLLFLIWYLHHVDPVG